MIASCTNGDKLDVEEPSTGSKKRPAETETDRTRSPNRLKEAAVREEELQKTTTYAVAEEEELHSTKNTDITATAHDLFYCS